MKVELWMIGKTNEAYLKDGISIFEKRIKRYLPFQIEILPDIKNAKNLSPENLKIKEGESFLKRLDNKDFLILLDERGKQFSSIEFSKYLESRLQHAHRKLIFLIGGAFGFSDAIYFRANQKISLSKMTFSHQMIRVFFLEQLYRAMTILRKEPYHNE